VALIYVTGVSGSGKSKLCEELVRRGHDAHDSDREGNASFVSRMSGEHVPAPSLDGRTPAFVAEFEWRFIRSAIERFAARAADETVFFLGTAGNEREVWDLFDLVIYLAIDETTLRQRVATRTGNDFGKSDDELRRCLEWLTEANAEFATYGATYVDATQPLEAVFRDVLEASARVANDPPASAGRPDARRPTDIFLCTSPNRSSPKDSA
jgi:gluconate kinase